MAERDTRLALKRPKRTRKAPKQFAPTGKPRSRAAPANAGAKAWKANNRKHLNP